jgi:FAD synthase
LELWNSNIDVSFINIKGPVVESKKIAKTSLGMPTANFKVDENLGKSLISYPNGIYVGNFKFLKNPDISYRAVCSLGINMHYEN